MLLYAACAMVPHMEWSTVLWIPILCIGVAVSAQRRAVGQRCEGHYRPAYSQVCSKNGREEPDSLHERWP